MNRASPSRLLSDSAIVNRAAGGSQRAFAAIFERYHQDLYRYCAAILGNSEEAHDAVQNTMLKVLRALPGETRALKLKPWLYRVAHNEAIDLIRARRGGESIDVESLVGDAGPAEEVEARDRLGQLIADISELPTRQRGALVMREMGGLGYDQIGAALQTSPAVARQTLYEARLALRQMSEGREMPCEEVMRAISDDDGRVLRRRDIRAHLLDCESCQTFRTAISERSQEFAALSSLPAAVSAGILQSLLGGAGAGSGTGAAAAVGGKALAGSVALKSAAVVCVVGTIGVFAADERGMVDLGLGGRHHRPADKASEPSRPDGEPVVRTARAAALGAASKVSRQRRTEAPPEVRRAHAIRSSAKPDVRPDRAAQGDAAEQAPGSKGRHLGWSKGRGHTTSPGEPAHPDKGKKTAAAPSPAQPNGKGRGHATHDAPEKTRGGKAQPHPPHPEKSQAASPPPADTPADEAHGNDKHGQAAAE